MSKKNLTPEDKLAAVESLIASWRPDRAAFSLEQSNIYDALCAIASDIRGLFAASRGEALVELQRRIDTAHRSRTSLGYEREHLVALAQDVIGRWPTIRQALERADHAEILARTIADACEEIGCEADGDALIAAIRDLPTGFRNPNRSTPAERRREEEDGDPYLVNETRGI